MLRLESAADVSLDMDAEDLDSRVRNSRSGSEGEDSGGANNNNKPEDDDK